jgi:hypothetical protein
MPLAGAAWGGGGGAVWQPRGGYAAWRPGVAADGACVAGAGSAEEARRAYKAERQLVIDELRRAREEAERQRRAILLQFGRAVGRQWL